MTGTILITGGCGFVGSNVAIHLKQIHPGLTIIAFDNLRRRGSELNIPRLREAGITFIHGDIRSKDDIAAAGAFDIMIEASAEPSVLAGLDSDPGYVIDNNLYGSINCFNACVKHKAKLIFLSTSRVYPIHRIEQAAFTEAATRFAFSANQQEPGLSENGISEDLNLDGARSFYGTTKLSSELFIREYAEFYGIQAAVTRFGVIAGPCQMGKTDQGVVALWLAKHFWRQELKYIGYGGTGKQVRDLLHIDDAVRLIRMQVENIAPFEGKVFNAGGGLECSASLLEMTTVCEEITGNRIAIGSEPENRPADLRIYVTDNTRITRETGWKPKRTVRDIFEDTYAWMREHESILIPILK